MKRSSDRHKQLHLFIDGASRGNPGESAIGFIVKTPDGAVVKKKGVFIGETTNNVAEYMALLQGLSESLRYEPSSIVIYSDSKLLVNQIKGIYRVRDNKLMPLYKKAIELLEKFSTFDILYIDRRENREADRIANCVLDEKSLKRL